MIEFINQHCWITQIAGVAITSLIIIIGWKVTNIHAQERQNRLEKTAKKEELLCEINKLVSAAREYYVGDTQKRKISEYEVYDQASKIDRIIVKIEKDNGELYKKYTVLYEAITDGAFGSNSSVDDSVSQEKYKRIMLARNQLSDDIELKLNYADK